MAFFYAFLALLVPIYTLNCLKQTFPQYYFGELPNYEKENTINLEILTLLQI